MDLRPTFSLLLLLLLGLCNAHHGNDHGADNDILVKEDMATVILRMNNGSSGFLLEGDMLIPRTRTAMKCLNKAYSCLWPKSANGNVEVPFLLSQGYEESEKRMILQAMKSFESKTCIRFVPRDTQRGYLSIEPRFGCFSLLGYAGDKQVIALQRFGCIRQDIIQHELMHALGFYHEHTRSDRDQYVRINWDNIIDYYVRSFQTMDTNNLNTPYDYTSVMHYQRNAFGDRGAETIIPIPDPTVTLGGDDLSNIDVIRINRLYKCYNYI